MSINLTISFDHPSAVSNKVSYARIDNILNPVFINVPNIVGSSGSGVQIATNIPDGQYQVNITPVYADLRVCDPTIRIKAPCGPLFSINAFISSNNLVISYLAPSSAPKVRMTVNYPNGGSFVGNFVNNGNNIVIALPPGLVGTFTVAGQTVCDETSGFYSPFSSQVSIDVTDNNVSISNQVSPIVITNVTGINSFVLPQLVNFGETVSGTHTAFYGGITATFTGTPGVSSMATLQVNGTIIQCVNVPNTSGGSVVFSPASFSASDLITITFNNGSCP